MVFGGRRRCGTVERGRAGSWGPASVSIETLGHADLREPGTVRETLAGDCAVRHVAAEGAVIMIDGFPAGTASDDQTARL